MLHELFIFQGIQYIWYIQMQNNLTLLLFM